MGDRRITDNRLTGERASARYAYLRSDGTAYIVGGSAVAGIAAYAYQLLGGRVLGAEAFAPVSVLLTIHFLTFIVVLMPIEQLMVRRLTVDRSRPGMPASAYWLAIVTTLAATAYAFFGVDEYLNGDRRFIVFTALTVLAHLLFADARGHLAGWRRFKAYGMSSGAASVLRLLIAVAVTIAHPSATGFALGLILGPFIVLLWRPFRQVDVDRAQLDEGARAAMSDRGLLVGLVLAAAATQALLLSGPLVVGVLGGSAVEISAAFAAFTLGRAPLVFGYNLLARVLPPFTEMAARGEKAELRAWARGMSWAAFGLSIVGGVIGWYVGPWVVEIAFGADFVAGQLEAASISAGVVLAGAGLFVGQILVARGQAVRLGVAWLVGLAAAAASIAFTTSLDEVSRVSLGFAVGAAVALVALVMGAVLMTPDERKQADSQQAYLVAKRTADIAVSLVLLIFAVPVILIAGLVVRIDSPGPVFFRQTRIGKGASPFGMLKIRTMEADADEAVFADHLARLEASRHIEMGSPLRIEDDLRVTRTGRFLRRWSIDELPNLWNVLRGSMSLVGPRPLVPAEAELVGITSSRFVVKPGITGLAQIEGRDAITMAERNQWDEHYVANRSTRMDLGILVRTVGAIFTEPGD